MECRAPDIKILITVYSDYKKGFLMPIIIHIIYQNFRFSHFVLFVPLRSVRKMALTVKRIYTDLLKIKITDGMFRNLYASKSNIRVGISVFYALLYIMSKVMFLNPKIIAISNVCFLVMSVYIKG